MSVELHAPLVRKLAKLMIAKVPANVELDDLIQAGMIALSDAIVRYDAEQGAQFETYATTRIRGAMLDELRRSDWLSRSDRESARAIETTRSRLEQWLGRPPAESEVAAKMGVPLDAYHRTHARVNGVQILYLEDLTAAEDDDGGFLDRHVADTDADPAELLANRRMREAVVDAIAGLPERERAVMGMFYDDDMTLDEIGAVLGVTGCRIHQLRNAAIRRVRLRMRDWLHENDLHVSF